MSVTDTLYLVGKRATLLRANLPTSSFTMACITDFPVDQTQTTLEEEQFSSCNVACRNSPTTTVISGKSSEIELLCTTLGRITGVKAAALDLPYAFHSAQMDHILP